MDANRPRVIAVSGPAGAGKTSLLRAAAARLGAPALYFDDFAADCRWWPDYPPESELTRGTNYRRWLAEGAEPDKYVSSPAFAAALASVRAVADRLPVFVEEPWGRCRRETAALIDFVAYIDLPVDIALCRRVLRDAEQGGNPLKFIRQYHDLAFTHFYRLNREAVVPAADVVLDGFIPLQDLADQLLVASGWHDTVRDHPRNG